MRRVAVYAVLVLSFIALSNVDLGPRFRPAAGAGLNENATSAASHNDTRPVAPGGYLCVHGAKGRLNNLILQNLVGLHMAHHLNRTLLVDPEVGTYYDVDRLSLTAYADSPYRAAAEMGQSPHASCGSPQRISPYRIDHGRTIPERFDDYGAQTEGKDLASVDNNDVWYWLGRPPEEVYADFFRGLVPRKPYMDKVDAFLDERNLGSGSFNAVHLRNFEGKCGYHDVDLCCPKMGHVQSIIVERGGSLLDPLFVASDGQCAEDVRRSYTNATDPVIVGYDGPCAGTECAVLDFEACVRAAGVFVGNLKSSGDMNIREWRTARFGRAGRTSVLSRDGEMAAMEAKHVHVTRYVVGHWRWRPDCGAVGPAKRGQPCV